jgi:hypothetical protein
MELGPEIEPAAEGAGLKVTENALDVTVPQLLNPLATIFPLEVPNPTNMEFVELLPVLPEGSDQTYPVAPVIPDTV